MKSLFFELTTGHLDFSVLKCDDRIYPELLKAKYVRRPQSPVWEMSCQRRFDAFHKRQQYQFSIFHLGHLLACMFKEDTVPSHLLNMTELIQNCSQPGSVAASKCPVGKRSKIESEL